VWVLEYFEINEMNFVFCLFFIGEWLVILDYRSWVVLLAFGSFYGHSVCFLSFCHFVRNDCNLFWWSIIMVMILVRDNIRDNIYCPTPSTLAVSTDKKKEETFLHWQLKVSEFETRQGATSRHSAITPSGAPRELRRNTICSKHGEYTS
jgi:hypothetical protein